MTNEETYLGDGVYASFDGYQVWLRAPTEFGNHRIALEPDVLGNLNAYVADLQKRIEAMMADAHVKEEAAVSFEPPPAAPKAAAGDIFPF